MKMNLVAHYEEGTSDKIYMACIRANADGTYTVLGKWGRNGRTLSSMVKLTTRDAFMAKNAQDNLFAEKMAKGYVDIDSAAYRGSVTRNDPCVRESMELEANDPAPVQKKPTPQEETEKLLDNMSKSAKKQKAFGDVAVCVDNTGIEDKFDEGIEYLCEPHKNSDMLYVYDRFAQKQEYMKNRFSSD